MSLKEDDRTVQNESKYCFEQKWREFCLWQEDISEGQWPHSTKWAKKLLRKNWREFCLCKRLLFVMHQTHSTQLMRKLCQKIGEHSVHAEDCFAQFIGHTVHRPESWLELEWPKSRPCNRLMHRCAALGYLKNFAKVWQELHPCDWVCLRLARVDTSKQIEKRKTMFASLMSI